MWCLATQTQCLRLRQLGLNPVHLVQCLSLLCPLFLCVAYSCAVVDEKRSHHWCDTLEKKFSFRVHPTYPCHADCTTGIYKFHFPMVSLQESLPQFSSRKNLFVKLPLTWRKEEGRGRVRNRWEDDEGRIRKVKGKIESEEAELGV